MSTGRLELCRDRIELSGEAILGIHSNVAGDSHSYTDGHAWISVQTPSRTIFLGLWPDGHPRVLNQDPACTDVRVNMELGVTPAVSRFYNLTSAQLIKLNDIINRPELWGYTNNCANWATAVLNEVVGAGVSAVDYIIFSTPRELGRELALLEAKDPTSPFAPRVGAFQEPSSLSRQGSSW